MKSMEPGKSHRTPIKHFVLNLALGQVTGVLALRRPDVPARLPLHVFDLCAGDGVSEAGHTSSPEIIHKHINFPALRGEAHATLIERREETFAILQDHWGNHPRLKLMNGDSRGLKLRPLGRDVAVFIHVDPNSIAEWPVTPAMIATFTRATTFLATLGCNVGGLKRLGFEEHRKQWYDHVRALLAVPPWHDVQLYVLDRDQAQWAYLLRVPSAWADDTARAVLRYGNRHWPNGLKFASAKRAPTTFNALCDELFLTRKERGL